jgi:hypothetical protein
MGAGIRTGILHSTKDYFTVLAADGQVKAGELDKMIPLVNGSNIVLSRYDRRPEGWRRKLYSRGFRFCMRMLLGIRLPLEGIYLCPCDAARTILGTLRSNSFLLSFELLDNVLRGGRRYEVASIECRPRRAGGSKVANVRQIARILGEMLKNRPR